MIIVKLEGGHSNQLFQYATGRRLAEKLGVKLYMDKHWFGTIAEGDTQRFYELGDYKFDQSFIDRQDFAPAEDKPDNLKIKFCHEDARLNAKPHLSVSSPKGEKRPNNRINFIYSS